MNKKKIEEVIEVVEEDAKDTITFETVHEGVTHKVTDGGIAFDMEEMAEASATKDAHQHALCYSLMLMVRGGIDLLKGGDNSPTLTASMRKELIGTRAIKFGDLREDIQAWLKAITDTGVSNIGSNMRIVLNYSDEQICEALEEGFANAKKIKPQLTVSKLTGYIKSKFPNDFVKSKSETRAIPEQAKVYADLKEQSMAFFIELNEDELYKGVLERAFNAYLKKHISEDDVKAYQEKIASAK